MAETKYYHAENARRGPIGGVVFDIYGIFAGSAFGVYATDNEAEQAAINAQVGQLGVSTISQAEYEDCLKKKPQPTDTTWTPSRPPPGGTGPAIKGKGAAVVGGEGQEPESAVKVESKVESLDQALELTEAPGSAPANNKPAPPKNRVKGQRENQ